MITLAAPHLVDTPTLPSWLQNALLAFIGVVIFDKWADRIPGVKGWNRGPQALTLVYIACAMYSIREVPLVASVADSINDFNSRVSDAFSVTWNVAGILLGVSILAWLGLRYCRSEKLIWDGALFGVAALALASLVPAVDWVLEVGLYSLVTGLATLFIVAIDFLANLGVS